MKTASFSSVLVLGAAALLSGLASASPRAHADLLLVGDTGGREGDILSFSAFAEDVGSDPLHFAWDFGDGTAQVSGTEESAVAHRYEDDGTYTVTVRASGGTTALEASREVVVEPVRPTIHVLSDEADGQTVRLQAQATDPGDDELTYVWDFGDGSPPREGVDLEEVTHEYAQAGDYEVTLTVIDEDGLETVRTLGVGANPGFLGEVAGEVPRFTFAGTSGKAALMNALGFLPGLSSAIPMGGGVADLSGSQGVCLVNAGFWDDENRAHINFQLTLPSEAPFEPRTYLVGWEHPDDGMAPGQLLVNALVLGIDPTYEETRAGAESMQIMEGGGGLGGLLDMAGSLGDLLTGGGMQLGPGRNWQLTANAGALTIERITHDRMYGELTAYLGGAWLQQGGSGEATYVEIEGRFAWEMDDVAQANMSRCGDREFAIDTHTPWVEEENVAFDEPKISLSFTLPYRRSTVTDATFEVGWLDGQGRLQPVGGRLVHDDDEVTVHFVPDEPLDDAVYHMVRVRGGQAGVRGASDDATLPHDYEWRFSTVPDLVPDPGGGGAAPQNDVPEPVHPAVSGPSADHGYVNFPTFEPGEAAVASQLVQKLCDRTEEDEWSTKPTVDVLVYQSACNQKLVPGKPALARVYLNWTYPDGKKGVDQYSATVQLVDGSGSAVGSETKTFKRQSRYSDAERRKAANSANITWTPGGSGPQAVKAVVRGRSVGASSPTEDLAHQPRALRTMSKLVTFDVPIVFPKVGSWNDGIPRDVMDRWTGPLDVAGDGVAFAEQNFPVLSITPKVDTTPIDLPNEPADRDFEPCGPNDSRDCMHYETGPLGAFTTEAGDWLEAALIAHFTRAQGTRPHLVLAVVPEDYGGDWGGVTKHHVSLFQGFSDVRDRTPAVILIKADMNTRTVAHELGHYLGLPHLDDRGDADRDPGIEGFRLEPNRSSNKSYVEGNGASSSLISLMEAGDADKVEDNNFILNEQYEDLLEHIEENDLWTEASIEPAGAREPVGARTASARGSAPTSAPSASSGGPSHAALDGPTRPAPSSGRGAAPAIAADDGATGARQERRLLVTGYVHPDGPWGWIDPLVEVEAPGVTTEPGDYSIRLRSADGALLEEISVEPERRYEANGEVRERTLYPVRATVPRVEGLATIEIADPTGQLVVARSAGAGAPSVSFLRDGSGVWESGGSVRWEGSDPDGDELTYSLAYRPDAESPWIPVVADQLATEATPDPGWLSPGAAPRFRLTASDGLHSTTVESDAVRPRLTVVGQKPAPTEPAPVTAVVSVRFNGELATSQPDAPITLRAVDGSRVEGSVRLQPERGWIHFVPSAELQPGSTYTAELSAATGRHGTRSGAVRWTFDTDVDEERPTVVRTTPRDDAIAIPTDAWFMVEFSEAMDSTSVVSGLSIRTSDGDAVPVAVRYADAPRAGVVNLPTPLQPATTYELVVGAQVTDRSGNSVEPRTVTFTTAGSGGPRRAPGGGIP